MNVIIIAAILGAAITAASAVWVQRASKKSSKDLEVFKAQLASDASNQKTLGDVYVKAQGVYDILVEGLREEINRLSQDNQSMRTEMAAMRRDLDRMRLLLVKHSINFEGSDDGPHA